MVIFEENWANIFCDFRQVTRIGGTDWWHRLVADSGGMGLWHEFVAWVCGMGLCHGEMPCFQKDIEYARLIKTD